MTLSTAKNLSQLVDNKPITQPLDIFALVFMGILFVLGVSGNLFTIYVLSFVKKTHLSAYDLMIVLLSISDLICAFIVPSMFGYGTITHFRRWDFGLIGCKILLSVLSINVTISQGILILMSTDRYLAIAKPFQRKVFSKKNAALYVLLAVLFAMLLATPKAYALELHYNRELSMETCNTPGSKNHLMLGYAAINLTRDIISTIVFAATGRKIYEALITNSSNMAQHGCMGTNIAVNISYVKQTHKMLRLMLIVFSICTIPLDAFQFCVYVYFQVQLVIRSDVYYWIRSINTVLYLCQTSNAVVNVFIYGTRHRDFQPIFRRLSKMKNGVLRRVFPKTQGANLNDENMNNINDPPTITRCQSDNDVRVIKMVQFSFDGLMVTD